MFKERWMSVVEEFRTSFNSTAHNYLDPEVYRKQVDILCSNIIDAYAAQIEGGVAPAKAKDEVRKFIGQNGHNIKRQVELLDSKYKALFVLKNQHLNRFIQESRADLKDRLRYLAFRMLTAVGIAAVVLTTGYLAHRWQIPLPLLRMPGVTTS